MKISFILPVYNEQTTIVNCIKSLLDQKEVDFEILVTDDCSTDHTKDLIDTFKNNKKILVVENELERKGAAFLRNKLNKLSQGDIIAVCDSDLYYPIRGQAIMAGFTEKPEWGVFYSSLNLVDQYNPNQKYTQLAYKWDFKSKCPISHPTSAIKREIALNHPYKELSKETDFYEFMFLDIARDNIEFGGCQESTMLKYEYKSNRNMKKSYELKYNMYKEYGIDVPEYLQERN